MSSETTPPVRRGSLFVLSAPSGTGKSSVVKRLLKALPRLHFSISATTRSPRGAERDGVEYHFLRRADMERRRDEGDLLEHAEVHGNLYGTLRSETERALEAGLDVLLDIDVQGAAQVAASGMDAVLILLLPPSRAELERRLTQRGTESEADLRRRLEAAFEELARVDLFDHVVLNDDLDEAVENVIAIVRSARSRREAMTAVFERVRASFERDVGAER